MNEVAGPKRLVTAQGFYYVAGGIGSLITAAIAVATFLKPPETEAEAAPAPPVAKAPDVTLEVTPPSVAEPTPATPAPEPAAVAELVPKPLDDGFVPRPIPEYVPPPRDEPPPVVERRPFELPGRPIQTIMVGCRRCFKQLTRGRCCCGTGICRCK